MRRLFVALLSCSLLLFSVVHAAPPPAVKLYALDCGRARFTDLGPFADTGEYDGHAGTLMASCFAIVHPKGTLLWDAGLGDRYAMPREGTQLPLFHASVPVTLESQLKAVGLGFDRIDYFAFSHGHADHIDDLVSCARASDAPVIGIHELCDWLVRRGIRHTAPMNKGGSQGIAGLAVSMTDARHSSGFVDAGQMIYMGEACGYVIRLEDRRAIYYAGDTALFGDMRLIGEMYRPEIAFLPIGDRFTMGPEGAARACSLLVPNTTAIMRWPSRTAEATRQ